MPRTLYDRLGQIYFLKIGVGVVEVFAKPAVCAIIERLAENKTYILLQERSKSTAPKEEGLLEIPGGKIREFENIYDALRREIYEETGLRVVDIKGEAQAAVFNSNGYRVLHYEPFSCTQSIAGNSSFLLQTFICTVKGEPLNRSDEAKNIRWVSLLELDQVLSSTVDMFYPMHVATLKKYLAKRLKR